MRSKFFVQVLSIVAIGVGFAACGGDDGDDGGVDAPSAIDAPGGGTDAAVDAAAGLTGLGQLCVPSMQGADCPAEANGCLSFGGTMGICTKVCVQSATFMTNAQSQPGPLNPDPATQNSMCTAIYTGSVGTAVCAIPANQMPAGALQPNTTYTVLVACGIQCGTGGACPTGLTCNTQANLCTP